MGDYQHGWYRDYTAGWRPLHIKAMEYRESERASAITHPSEDQ